MKRMKVMFSVLLTATVMTGFVGCSPAKTDSTTSTETSTEVGSTDEVESTMEVESTEKSADIEISGGSASISVGADGKVVINAGGSSSEEPIPGVVITYGSEIKFDITGTGIKTVENHAISIEQAEKLKKSQDHKEMLEITNKVEPLYYGTKEAVLKDGFGYYFTSGGHILVVRFAKSVIDQVSFAGSFEGVVVSVVNGTISVVEGSAYQKKQVPIKMLKWRLMVRMLILKAETQVSKWKMEM